MPKRRPRRLQTKGDKYFGLLGGFLVGYIGAEATVQRFMHPLHWLVAAIGAAMGYFGALLWHFWRRAWREERAGRDQ